MNFMQQAINIAKTVKGEIAVGAVIVKDNEIIASACNRKEKDNGAWRTVTCMLRLNLARCVHGQ